MFYDETPKTSYCRKELEKSILLLPSLYKKLEIAVPRPLSSIVHMITYAVESAEPDAAARIALT